MQYNQSKQTPQSECTREKLYPQKRLRNHNPYKNPRLTCAKSERVIRQRVAETALPEYTAKLTPSTRGVAPRGTGEPRETWKVRFLVGDGADLTTTASDDPLAPTTTNEEAFRDEGTAFLFRWSFGGS